MSDEEDGDGKGGLPGSTGRALFLPECSEIEHVRETLALSVRKKNLSFRGVEVVCEGRGGILKNWAEKRAQQGREWKALKSLSQWQGGGGQSPLSLHIG